MPPNDNNPDNFLSSLFDSVTGFFSAGFKYIWSEMPGTIFAIKDAIVEAILKYSSKLEVSLWDSQLKTWRKRGWLDEDSEKDLREWLDLSFPFNIFGFLLVTGFMIINYFKILMMSVGGDTRRKLLSKYKPEDARLEQILLAGFYYPEKMPDIKQILSNQGYDDNQIDLMIMSAYRLYDVTTVRDLFHRGVLSEELANQRLKSLGYTDTSITELKQTWPIIPSLGDIVRYIAKEAFEPEMIDLFGLLEGYPIEAEEWAAKQGLEKRWVEAEWVAHWRDLGIEFMLEAYHRGIVEWPLVERYMALIEIPPKLREIVRDTAFNVYTRVDVRRMHHLGVLNDDELVQAYKDQGYDDEKALNMAEFTIRYNAQSDKDLTKAEVLKGFTEALIKREDAEQMLLDMDYSPDEVNFLLEYEQLKKDKDLEKLKLDNIKNRYQNNLIDEFETRSLLGKLHITAERIEELVTQWNINKFEAMKIPSKTDLDKFYKAGLIDEKRYYLELLKLGYGSEYSNWYLALATKAKK